MGTEEALVHETGDQGLQLGDLKESLDVVQRGVGPPVSLGATVSNDEQ